MSPADYVFGDVVASLQDTLPDALDVRLDGIQRGELEADREACRLGIAHQPEGLLAAQCGLEDEGLPGFDHLGNLLKC